MVLIDVHRITADALPALQELPTRRAPSEPEPDQVIRWERVAPERYVVLDGERVAGFVDVVGAVFVVLRGTRYDRAVEVAQTLVFQKAIEVLTC
ncbi:hypothetical protein [Microbacterium sp.]|uniref:hypothetical protein n=1 Tax=Microbacterium sp. TaxID=51671 RepID=UPI0028127F01|nr:hypothetical protein [Microbacterium sp.]